MANNSIGEEGIPLEQVQQVTRDIPHQQVQQKLANAIGEKEKLDYIMHGIAGKVGVEFSSRIKNPETVVRKIAQKRTQGRRYDLQDINDAYGGRFIVTSDKQRQQIKSLLTRAESLGVFGIDKAERVHNDTYSAYHVDFKTSSGVKGEAQIMTPQESLESVANHSLRAVHGEKPPENVQELRDKQAVLAHKTPNGRAIQQASTIQKTAQQINGKPLDPRIIASILTK